MNRKLLGILAVVIILLMALVATAGLDNLPRELKTTVAAAETRVASDRTLFDQERAAVERALKEEPALFQTRAASWAARIGQARERISKAKGELGAVRKLTQEDRRDDARKVEQGVARAETMRAGALQEVKSIRAEAERWLGYKRNLPAHIESMTRDYEAIRSFDPDSATAAARKAMFDWPAKRPDLEQRIASLAATKSRAEQVWESSSPARAQSASQNSEAVDYAALFASADELSQLARQAREGADAVNQLAGQLYVNWDKLLLEVSEDQRKVRLVRTRFPDATLQNGQTSQEEKWEPLAGAEAAQMERNVGLVIARKPAGKYESEAESSVQAPGYAYVAPPGQANAYGSWNNGVWSWLPQYLLLSQMLRGPSVPPITMGDYGSYQRARQRGEVYYRGSARTSGGGLRGVMDRVRSGSSGGGFWRERAASQPGGYRGSRYENRGSYSGSRYQSRPSGGFRSYSRGMGGFRRGGRR